jgi:amino-acid N-acetyltransferase
MKVPVDVDVRLATPDEPGAIRDLLAACGLPAADVGLPNQEFLVACNGGQIVGCVGAELYGGTALLRSLAIVLPHRGKGMGDLLLREGVGLARRRGAGDLYALTTTIEPLLARRGFVRVERGDVPEALRMSQEFASICPGSAACMVLRVEPGGTP